MLNICTVCPHSALYSKIFGKFIEATQSEQSIVIIHLHTNNISIQCRIDYCLVSGLLMIDFARVFIRFYKKVESQTTNMDLFVIFFYTNSKKNTRNEFHYGIWWMVWCVVYERNYTYPSQNIYSFFFWISISNSPMHSAKNILTIQQRIIITHTYWICLAKTKFKWQIDVEQIYFTIISSPFEMRVLRTTFADSIRVHLQVKRNSIVIGYFYFNNLTWRLNLS